MMTGEKIGQSFVNIGITLVAFKAILSTSKWTESYFCEIWEWHLKHEVIKPNLCRFLCLDLLSLSPIPLPHHAW
jgi:hypothetical protein